MDGQGIAQIIVYAVALVALGYPLGIWMARIYTVPRVAGRFLASIERGFYRVVRTDPTREQDWKGYGKTVLVFSVLFMGLLYAIQRLQGHLFLNPDHMKAVPAHLSLNTAASFITNTNWQFYGGEYTMSYLTQMAGLAVQNFVSAAVGIAVLAAVIRGISRRSSETIGNFWVDLYRTLAYLLVPLSIVVTVLLVWQGVPQTFSGHATATTLQGAHQAIARGPGRLADRDQAARDERRRLLQLELRRPVREPDGPLELHRDAGDPADPGGRGVHVREDGARATACLGRVRGDVRRLRARGRRQPAGRAARVAGAPQLGREHHARARRRAGGNMSDKEVRFGLASTAIWTVATSDASNGSVNGGFDAMTPAGGAVPLVNLFLGEVIFGGVGSGLYGMFFYIIIAVFVAGLMVGRTPEWLGKKIDAREIKFAALGALFVPTMVLPWRRSRS